MFNGDVIESLIAIFVFTAVIVWFGVVLGRREDRAAGSPRSARTADDINSDTRKTA